MSNTKMFTPLGLTQKKIADHISCDVQVIKLFLGKLVWPKPKTEFDVKTRFLARAEKGSVKRGLEVLDKLDKAYS